MSDVVWFAYMALQAGYVLGRVRPIERWRRAAIFRLWDLPYIEDRRARKRRAWLVAVEMAVTHPVGSWRALRGRS